MIAVSTYIGACTDSQYWAVAAGIVAGVFSLAACFISYRKTGGKWPDSGSEQ